MAQAQAPAHPDPISGTYEIVVCRTTCDATRPVEILARGHLILEAARYSLLDLPEGARSYFERYEEILSVRDAGNEPNACFVLERTPGAQTYGGASRVGLTVWSRTATDSLALSLYHSTDAGYRAEMVVRGGILKGRGVSWGRGDAAVRFPEDTIVGRRIGAPDRGMCIRAAELEAARRAR